MEENPLPWTWNNASKKFKNGAPLPDNLGAYRDYNVDIIPKFIMSSGLLVQILIKTDVTRYLEFKPVDGSFVFHQGKPHKVPSNAKEATTSSLMGIFEKRRCASFLEYVWNYDEKDAKTHKGHDLNKKKTKELYTEFGLKEDTIDFIGHAMALQHTDDYLEKPALEYVKLIRLYAESVLRFGNSPYIYPLYGLGEMPQGFARLSAIYGGTYMLSKPVDEIIMENGVVVGVKSEGEIAKCKFVIADPSYFPDRVTKNGKVVRQICILSGPVPGTNNAESCQIIIPQKEIKRKHDIYVSVVSSTHNVAPKGKYLAIVSTVVETNTPEKELEAGLKILGKIDESFFYVSDLLEPKDDGKTSKIFISKSYDPDTHDKYSCEDIMDIYTRITGKQLDLTPPKKEEQKQE